jgi:transposase
MPFKTIVCEGCGVTFEVRAFPSKPVQRTHSPTCRGVVLKARRARQWEAAGVSRDALVELYLNQQLTTREIGKRINASQGTVQNWLRFYGIPLRGPGGRCTTKPARADLERLIHDEHRSYKEIGGRYGLDASAIYHWVKRYGIKPPTRSDTVTKGHSSSVTPAALRALYTEQELTTAEIANKFSVSPGIIQSRLRAFGIPTRPEGFGGLTLCSDGHKVRSSYERRVCEWLTEHGIEHEYEPRLSFDRRSKADFLARGCYIEVWGVYGNEKYKERKARKVAGYKASGLPLLQISYFMFFAQKRGAWTRRLERQFLAKDEAHRRAA